MGSVTFTVVPVALAGTVTVEGTEATVGSKLAKATNWPLGPAGFGSVSVRVAVAFSPMLNGFGVSVICMFVTLTVAVPAVKPGLDEAVIVALPPLTAETVTFELEKFEAGKEPSVVVRLADRSRMTVKPLGMEGAFEAMGTGSVDLNWAKEHHGLWLEEEIAKGRVSSMAASPPAE